MQHDEYISLWTHHPSSFDVSSSTLFIDHTLGMYWNLVNKGFRYREILPQLIQLLARGDQFLWCCTSSGGYEPSYALDRVQWKLEIPISQVILFREKTWEDLVWTRSEDWTGLVCENMPDSLYEVGALAFLPLKPEWITCNGQMDVRKRRK